MTFKRCAGCLLVVVSFFAVAAALGAEEFPIAVGRDSTFGGAAAFDGVNYLVSIVGDTFSQYNITAQLVSPIGELVGNRISMGGTGTWPGAAVAFDGTNYLLAWRRDDGGFRGQFVSPSGGLVGPLLTIAEGVSDEYPGLWRLAFGGSTYLAIFVKTDGYLYGRRVGTDGSVPGGEFPISGNYAREISLAYDGTNYLAAWLEASSGWDENLYGQFISAAGSPVGENFLIDGPGYKDNPTSLTFDGSRYLLTFHSHQIGDTTMSLLARFIATSGAPQETFTICGAEKDPFLACAAFGHDRYLITWTQHSNMSLMGRFYDPSGVPIDTPFVVFGALDGRTPLGACVFEGGRFFMGATRVKVDVQSGGYVFTDGDVYGTFLLRDLAAARVVSTLSPRAGQAYVPQGVFQNRGSERETGFNVTCRIWAVSDTFYGDTVGLPTLGPGDSARVDFAPWDVPGNFAGRQVKLTIAVLGANDDLASDDSLTIDLNISSAVEEPITRVVPDHYYLSSGRVGTDRGYTFEYGLPQASRVKALVYDGLGAVVARLEDGTRAAGVYALRWNRTDTRGRTVRPGVYFLAFHAGTYQAARKLVVTE